MSKKSAARRGRSRDDVEQAGDGVVARLIDRTFENPATSGGLLVMALTVTAIISNAMFLQGARHPGPLFMTRPAEAPQAAGLPAMAPHNPGDVINALPMPHLAPRAAESADPVAAMLAMPETPVVAPVAALADVPIPPVAISEAAALITAIQRELARVGLYSGAIDGVSGPRTETAIRAFESAAGIVVTGQPSADVLAALKQPMPPRATNTIATGGAAIDQAAELTRRERQRAELIAAEERKQADLRARQNAVIVQTALNRIGYGPLPMDGVSGAATVDAIRRFELDNGMPITGEANDALVGRLVAIGAVKSG